MATLPGAWHYRVSAGTGRPGVSILWLGEVERLICNLYLNVAAHKIVWADPSLRYNQWDVKLPTISHSLNIYLTTMLLWQCSPPNRLSDCHPDCLWHIENHYQPTVKGDVIASQQEWDMNKLKCMRICLQESCWGFNQRDQSGLLVQGRSPGWWGIAVRGWRPDCDSTCSNQYTLAGIDTALPTPNTWSDGTLLNINSFHEWAGGGEESIQENKSVCLSICLLVKTKRTPANIKIYSLVVIAITPSLKETGSWPSTQKSMLNIQKQTFCFPHNMKSQDKQVTSLG